MPKPKQENRRIKIASRKLTQLSPKLSRVRKPYNKWRNLQFPTNPNFNLLKYSTIESAYDIEKLGKILDWINVMTYNLHGKWEKQTEHHSALEGIPGDKLTVTYAVDYWVKHGMPPSKIALGMAIYGQAFKLVNPANNGLGAAASGDPPAGQYTKESGFLSYYEICTKRLTVVSENVAPYGYAGDFWVGFDDPESLKLKVDFLKAKGLRGAMFWAIDLDDFKNACVQGKYPLLSAVAKALSGNVVPPTTHAPTSSSTEGPITTGKPTTAPTSPPSQRPSTSKMTTAIPTKPCSQRPSIAKKTTAAPTKPSTQRPSTTKISAKPPTQRPGSNCYPLGVWKKVPGMKKWCKDNCAAGYCPSSHCKCIKFILD